MLTLRDRLSFMSKKTKVDTKNMETSELEAYRAQQEMQKVLDEEYKQRLVIISSEESVKGFSERFAECKTDEEYTNMVNTFAEAHRVPEIKTSKFSDYLR